MEKFKDYLIKLNLAEKTINSYIYSVKTYLNKYITITKSNLILYKEDLIDTFKPKTVNLRLQGINKYLDFLKKGNLKLTFIKVQQKTYLENVISYADYKFLKNKLKEAGNLKWYFEIRFFAATGARVSELLQFKVEHVFQGFFDIYSKGGKVRRIYIPIGLKKDAIVWLKEINKSSGYLFTGRFGKVQKPRYVTHCLKHFAIKYGINPQVVYPHSFRHLFARNFLEKCGDITLLADLLGHESIETTRIYLRRSSAEQQTMVDTIVTW